MDNIRKCIFTLLFTLPALLFAGELINVNTADKDLLMSIKGVGEKRAEAIINYREQNGPFKNIEQLAEIKGLGQYFVDTNREKLVVDGNN